MKECCWKAIESGTLVRNGRAVACCPVCGKDNMLILLYLEDAGVHYVPKVNKVVKKSVKIKKVNE